MNAKVAMTACTAALLSLSLAGAGQAQPVNPKPAAAGAPRQCFYASSANGFAAPDEKTVNIRVGVKDVYQFEMLGPCMEIDWANSIALVSRGSNFICSGMDADIVSKSTMGPQRCPVRSVRKLTPDEIAALGKRATP
jgi:hypothetical protein